MKATFAVILILLCFASVAVGNDYYGYIREPPKGMLGIGTSDDYKYEFSVEWKDGYTYVWELEVDYGDVDTKPTFKWVFKRLEVTE